MAGKRDRKKSAVHCTQIANAIINELQCYSEEVAITVDECVDIVAEECAAKLRETSPKDSGYYAKNWDTYDAYKKRGGKRVIVRNKKAYQVTHLLEHGHALKGGKGRVKAIPHIKPVEEWAKEELPKLIEEKVKKV